MSNSSNDVHLYWFLSYLKDVQEVLLTQYHSTRFSIAHYCMPEMLMECNLPHTFKIFPSKACCIVSLILYLFVYLALGSKEVRYFLYSYVFIFLYCGAATFGNIYQDYAITMHLYKDNHHTVKSSDASVNSLISYQQDDREEHGSHQEELKPKILLMGLRR